MVEMIGLDEKGVMKRPTRRDGCVRRRAAEMALPAVKVWMGSTEGESDESIIKTLMSIGSGDGFKLAKELDDLGWQADAELVDIMGQGHIYDAEREMVQQWVQCVGVKQEHALGTAVLYDGKVGEIVKWYAETGEYGVRTPEQPPTSNWVVKAENIKLADDMERAA